MKMTAPAARPRPAPGEKIRNAMTCDVEDYFQVSAFAPYIDRDSWPTRECRVEAQYRTHPGAVRARRRARDLLHAGLDRRALSRDGAPHRRRPATSWPATATATCAPRTRAAPNSTTISARPRRCWKTSAARPCVGYRAPSFSIGHGNLWALDALHEAGYTLQLEHLPDRARPLRHARRAAFRVLPERPGRPARSADHHGAHGWPQPAGRRRRLLPPAAVRAVALDDGTRSTATTASRPSSTSTRGKSTPTSRVPTAWAPRRSSVTTSISTAWKRRLEQLTRDFTWDRMDRIFLDKP